MTTLIDFSNPILDKQTAEQLATNILDDFYVSEDVYNKFNLYFVLEISIIFYEKSGTSKTSRKAVDICTCLALQ